MTNFKKVENNGAPVFFGQAVANENNEQILIKNFYEAHEDTLFDQIVVAAVRGCSLATMERDRWAGGGIPFKKIGRKVRYRKADVLAWLDGFELKNSTTV